MGAAKEGKLSDDKTVVGRVNSITGKLVGKPHAARD
jgi:hypothetical protein